MPTLHADRVAASYVYYDAQTDDARLTLAVARTAADYGAAVANYTRLVDFEKGPDGRVHRRAGRSPTATRSTCGRSLVVNATGVWSDDVRALDEGTHPSSIRPAKGVHITVPWSLVQNQIAAVIPVPKDKRSVFVVPWGGEAGDHKFTYIGTTDTDYDGSIDDPQITPDDVEYLLRAINGAVTTTITEADILGTWAGPAAARARRDERAHRRPFPPSFGARLGERRDHGHRRQAHDVPPHGSRHRRRRGEGARRPGPATEPDQARAPARRVGMGLGRRCRPSSRRATAATRARCSRCLRADADARRADRARSPLLPKAEVVYAAPIGDGPHRRRRAVPPHPRPPARARRVVGRGRPTSRRSWRRSWVGAKPSATARSSTTGR